MLLVVDSYLHLSSDRSHLVSMFPSYHPFFFCLCVCLAVAGSVGVCSHWLFECVWTCVRELTFVLLEAENHSACGFNARHNVLGCVLFDCFISLIEHLLVHLQECPLFSVYFEWQLKTSLHVRVSLIDRLSDFQLILCGLGWTSLFPFTPDCLMSSIVYLLASLSFLMQQHCECRKQCLLKCVLIHFLLSLLCLTVTSTVSIWSRQYYGDICQILSCVQN